MERTARFMNEEDVAKAFEKTGYERLESVDSYHEKIHLRKTVELPEDEMGNVDVEIWKSGYNPSVKIFFPSIARDNTTRKKEVSINYTKTDEGMSITSVDFVLKGYRTMRWS